MANRKQTSPRIAKIASEILRDKRFSDKSKKVAGSTLSQARKSGKSK